MVRIIFERGDTAFLRRNSYQQTSSCTKYGPLPGTLLRVATPQGAVINVLNLFEVVSPSGIAYDGAAVAHFTPDYSGICLIVRLAFLSGS